MLIIYEETTYYPKAMLHRVENGRKCIFCKPCLYASRMFKIRGIECAVNTRIGESSRSKHTKNKQKIVIFDRMFHIYIHKLGFFGRASHFTPRKRKNFEGSSF